MELLYREYRERLLRLAFNIIDDWELAADIIHDVFLKYLKQKKSINNPKNWLVKSVVNRSLDQRKLAWRKFIVYLEDFSFLEKRSQQNYDDKDAISITLKKLTKKERAVIVLRDIEGYSTKEIAEILSIVESTVRVISKNARDKFIFHYEKE